jgi:hypothetical protein
VCGVLSFPLVLVDFIREKDAGGSFGEHDGCLRERVYCRHAHFNVGMLGLLVMVGVMF